MSKLSISVAWDETKAVLARDGRLFASVALALIILPAVVAGVLDPRVPGEVDAPIWFDLIIFIISLISIAGQLAMIRLALGPSVTVAQAISHGLRRLPTYIGAMLILAVPVVIIAILFGVVGALMGLDIERAAAGIVSPNMVILVLVMLLLFLFLAARFLLSMPVASAEGAGPLELLKRSWELTEGHWFKLFLFLLLILIAAVLIIGAVSMVAGSVVLLFFEAIEPMSVASLIVALVEAVFTGLFSVIFTLMLTRFYVQLSGRETVEDSEGHAA